MSAQLETKIEEVERKRGELEPRRSAAWATRSPRASTGTAWWRWQCAKRSTPARRRWAARCRSPGALRRLQCRRGRRRAPEAIEAAERDAFAIRSEVGPELLGALEGDERAERARRAGRPRASGVHALAVGMRVAGGRARSTSGALSIARQGAAVHAKEEELLEYLAGQAVVSIENASLHEAVSARRSRTS